MKYHIKHSNQQENCHFIQARAKTSSGNQFTSFIIFIIVILIVNLCPFDNEQKSISEHEISSSLTQNQAIKSSSYTNNLSRCFNFFKTIFIEPNGLKSKTNRITLADAKMLGKMAKVWFIKKKIKKLGKKLKKHSIAVPVITAIPIYEHSYYPAPHITHLTHAPMHHAASTSYSSALAAPAASQAAASSLVAAASSSAHPQRVAYRNPHHLHQQATLYAHPAASNSHQIINAYAPSPPLFVDDSAGLYGHYGNAYGRYDAGYHFW